MHLHLPKALHGWRDFAKEVGMAILFGIGTMSINGAVTGHVRVAWFVVSAAVAGIALTGPSFRWI